MNALERLKRMRGRVLLRAQRRWGAGVEGAARGEVRKVALILSAPRSGSSLLYALLRRSPDVYAPGGECVPFFKLHGLSSDEFPSDEVPASARGPRSLAGLRKDLLGDCSLGSRPAALDREERERYAGDLELRLPLQWPQARFPEGAIQKAAAEVFQEHAALARRFEPEAFYLRFLAKLRRSVPEIDPYYYDIPQERVAQSFPKRRVPAGPPGEFLLEEPPFILLEPRKRLAAADLGSKTLLLKSTVNCFRVDVLRELFPRARLKVLYLTRHPLASINGLCDGWRHRGFFSHNLRSQLKRPAVAPLPRGSDGPGSSRRGLAISGYSERGPWARWWWKFDLPPGWEAYRGRSLEEVCAFQWVSGNKAAQAAIASLGLPYLRARFEDLVAEPRSRLRLLREICGFLGADFEGLRAALPRRLPVVQATGAVDPARWQRCKEELEILYRDGRLRSMSRSLGYGEDLRVAAQ